MYHLYHTPAFVLGSVLRGVGSKLVSLFTRELGFLTAIAQSAREERSKLRYGLQDSSCSDITLVRGKEFWRLTRAECILNVASELRDSPEAARMVGRICALLRRLLAGEEKNEPLFNALAEGFRFVIGKPSKQSVEGTEIVLVLRVLYFLGYLAPRGEFDPFLSHTNLWDESVISKALLFRTLAVSEINNSLRETQL